MKSISEIHDRISFLLLFFLANVHTELLYFVFEIVPLKSSLKVHYELSDVFVDLFIL